jgi:hypothetical protein
MTSNSTVWAKVENVEMVKRSSEIKIFFIMFGKPLS